MCILSKLSLSAAIVAALLSACGQRRAAVPQILKTAVSAPNFSDSDPHDWQGSGPARYTVHGIDTSRWQGAVDWPTARANGVNFAYLKATEGGDRLDPEFAGNWRAAGQAGLPRGAYHYFYFCTPATEQARWFIRNVPRTTGALPAVLDMEWTPLSPTCTRRPPADTVRAEAAVFLALLEAHYGQRPLLYTSIDFFKANQLGELAGTEFWLRSVASHPSQAFPGQGWTFWQYSGTGLVPGVSGRTDLNVFAGSATNWAKWLSVRSQ